MPNYSETKRYIKSFAKLSEGWHFGEGKAPSDTDIRIMSGLLLKARLLGFVVFEAFPGVDGEIQLAIYDGDNFYSITIEPNAESKFTVSYEKEQTEVFFQEHATFYDVVARLEEFSFQPWNTPESFTHAISRSLTASPATLPSRTHPMAQESPALESTARLPKADQSVATSHASMEDLLAAIQSSIGSCRIALP
jgi:hypothetical protein